MWDNLLRVDWGRLTHAYGWARDAPAILHNMISHDETARAAGWDAFWGAINHQGDYYDATVAAIPFLIEAVAHPDTPERPAILYCFRELWLEAPLYGGDPLVADPPGGTDIPTPMLSHGKLAAAPEPTRGENAVEQDGDGEFDTDAYRRMNLCAWQTGRAIQAGRPAFERLLGDPDREVAAAAAALLLPWQETRSVAKRALVRTIADEPNPVAQARRILELGVYAAREDVPLLAEWVAPDRPGPAQAAAALVWAWAVNPESVPEPAATALRASSEPDSDAFARLPWTGVYRGPWALPANTAELILRLAESEDKELRWRAVQGLVEGRGETAKHLSAAQVLPVLFKHLSDDHNRIRSAAAMALSQHSESVLRFQTGAVPLLIRALEGHPSRGWGGPDFGLDSDASVAGHAARLLAALSNHLPPAQRQEALAGIDRAARRYADRQEEYVTFHHTGIPASRFLRQQGDRLASPMDWGLAELLVEFAFPNREDRMLSPSDCDRRLADAFGREPERAVGAAIQAVSAGSNRTAAVGAAQWLMTLGPAAEAALQALDAMATGPLDEQAREQARAAGSYIRQSLLVPREGAQDPLQGEGSARQRIVRLLGAAAAPDYAGLGRDVLIAELIGLIEDPNAYVRAGAAEGLAMLMPAPDEAAGAISALERMLADEAFAEVGFAGRFACEGRLFHWRKERRSPRAGAIEALSAAGRIPEGDRMLNAMLAEAVHTKASCGKAAVPSAFAIALWRAAGDAAGGFSAVEPRIRAVRQQCQNQPWPGHVCAIELAEVIRQLSGRLVR